MKTALVGLAVMAVGIGIAPVPGQASTFAKARVVKVNDGDTFQVDFDRNGSIDARVRLVGYDSPEHDTCGGLAATNALKSLVRHRVVELRSDTGTTGKRGRIERRAIVTVNGKRIDVTTWMLERGWGVWMPRRGEYTLRYQEHVAADRAARAGLGWFQWNRCSLGPYAGAALTLQAEYRADAAPEMSENQKRNQEFIRIRNDNTYPVSVDGWTIRVGNMRKYRVPAGGAIQPGEAIEIHVGSGTNTATDRYIGSASMLLGDASVDGGRHDGSGAYLIDPSNDIRAWSTWPCTGACADPSGGTLKVTKVVYAPRSGREYVQVTNTGTAAIRTGDYVLELWPYVVEFPTNHWLQPGETVTIYNGKGTNTHSERYLQSPSWALMDSGGRALLRTYNAIVVDCVRWGSKSCPS